MPGIHLHQKSLCRKDTPCQKEVPLCWERYPELPEGQAASNPDFCTVLPGHLQRIPVQRAPLVLQSQCCQLPRPGGSVQLLPDTVFDGLREQQQKGRVEQVPRWAHLRIRNTNIPVPPELPRVGRQRCGRIQYSQPQTGHGTPP